MWLEIFRDADVHQPIHGSDYRLGILIIPPRRDEPSRLSAWSIEWSSRWCGRGIVVADDHQDAPMRAAAVAKARSALRLAGDSE